MNILVRFNFNTIDAIANAFEGWYVDDVTITAAPGAGTIRLLPPNLLADGTFEIWAVRTDGQMLTDADAARIWFYASEDPSLPASSWKPLTATPAILNNGRVGITGLNTADAPARFFRAVIAP
jgi:hypothetical protein